MNTISVPHSFPLFFLPPSPLSLSCLLHHSLWIADLNIKFKFSAEGDLKCYLFPFIWMISEASAPDFPCLWLINYLQCLNYGKNNCTLVVFFFFSLLEIQIRRHYNGVCYVEIPILVAQGYYFNLHVKWEVRRVCIRTGHKLPWQVPVSLRLFLFIKLPYMYRVYIYIIYVYI